MKATGRSFVRFEHCGVIFRICCDRQHAVQAAVIRQRAILEDYIRRQPVFQTTLRPIPLLADAPEVACRMATAAERVGVGPMAAVAGAMAQLAGEAGLAAGAREIIVDNGGDLYLALARPAVIGLFAGEGRLAGRLGFAVDPEMTPLAICSSSGHMGHSVSLGACDLATVVARDAALADAAATQAANLVRGVDDLDSTLAAIADVEGVEGVLLVQEDRIGLKGRLPRLVRTGG